VTVQESETAQGEPRKPAWLRIAAPSGEEARRVRSQFGDGVLHSVCEEARCPNRAECWGCGTATFMVLGDLCTRNCRFCAVATAKEGRPVDPTEPSRLAGAIESLGLRYAVITSVDRDDLPDGGASHFASCVRAIKKRLPEVKVETLIPDWDGGRLDTLCASGPDVIAHNLETVERLQAVRDRRASWERSLATVAGIAARGAHAKSSLMVGLGETEAELLAAMDALRSAGCVTLVIGQYLRPTRDQLPVVEYVTPETFARYRAIGLEKGFLSVISAPLARTSYHARECHDAALSNAPLLKSPDRMAPS
jgi:lipoic acid synthetase